MPTPECCCDYEFEYEFGFKNGIGGQFRRYRGGSLPYNGLWIRNYGYNNNYVGSSYRESVRFVAIRDGYDFVYVAGPRVEMSEVIFPTYPLPEETFTHPATIRKYSKSGNEIWKIDTGQHNRGHFSLANEPWFNVMALHLDSSCNLYVCGQRRGDIYPESERTSSTVKKYDPDGTEIATINTGFAATGVCVPSSGNIYVGQWPIPDTLTSYYDVEPGIGMAKKYSDLGVFEGTLTQNFDNQPSVENVGSLYNLHAIDMDSSGNWYTAQQKQSGISPAFSVNVRKFNSDNVQQWSFDTSAETGGDNDATDIHEDGGDVYVASDEILLKLNSSGVKQWLDDPPGGVSVCRANDDVVYSAGGTTVRQHDASDGSVNWSFTAPDTVVRIAIANDGGTIVSTGKDFYSGGTLGNGAIYKYPDDGGDPVGTSEWSITGLNWSWTGGGGHVDDSGNVVFMEDPERSLLSSEAVIKKYDDSGSLVWSRDDDDLGSWFDTARSLAIDGDDIYILSRDTMMAVTKLGSDGQTIAWSKAMRAYSGLGDGRIGAGGGSVVTASSSGTAAAQCLVYDSSFSGTAFDSSDFIIDELYIWDGWARPTKIVHDGDDNIYMSFVRYPTSLGGLIAFNSNGDFLWIWTGNDLLGLAIDSNRNLYVGDGDLVKKFNSSGVLQWSIDPPFAHRVHDCAVGPDDSVYCCGQGLDDEDWAKLNPSTGAVIYAVHHDDQPVSSVLGRLWAIEVDENGDVFVGGSYSDNNLPTGS